jgi:hypothetical protein
LSSDNPYQRHGFQLGAFASRISLAFPRSVMLYDSGTVWRAAKSSAIWLDRTLAFLESRKTIHAFLILGDIDRNHEHPMLLPQLKQR